MHHQRFLALFRKVLSTPTAPFYEYLVAALIKELLAPLPHVMVSSDDYGNLIAKYQKGKKKPQLAFAAHMDHPGWVKHKNRKKFLGGVPKDLLDQHPVEWFGPFGMWKLTPFEVNDGIIRARVCDDLVGCASIVALLQMLAENQIETTVYGLFTRAEEVGFNGAVAMAKNWPLPEGVRFVSLETSSPRGSAEMGKGPVIRVGDRSSVFDDAITAELIAAGTKAKIPHQRCLLDGGSCEATAMNLYGIPAAGISVLLGNYHNVTAESGIAEEFVSVEDTKNLVKLIYATTCLMAAPGAESAKQAMKKRIEKRCAEHQVYFDEATEFWPKD
jgi:putative aminopeptidase FrvX